MSIFHAIDHLLQPKLDLQSLPTIKASIRSAGFPNWKTLRGLSNHTTQECQFTLKMNNNYRSYTKDQENIDVIFQRSHAIISEVRMFYFLR